jgi:hypothetical protein
MQAVIDKSFPWRTFIVGMADRTPLYNSPLLSRAANRI